MKGLAGLWIRPVVKAACYCMAVIASDIIVATLDRR